MSDRVLSTLRATLLSVFGIKPAAAAGSPLVGTYRKGDLYMDLNAALWICTAAGSPGTWQAVGSGSDSYQMELGGKFAPLALPYTQIGIEIVASDGLLTRFRARRGVVGSSGTTTIQLEQNGAAVGGATLSWTPADAAMDLKSVAISLTVAAGDYLSFRLTSKETGGEDIFAEVN